MMKSQPVLIFDSGVGGLPYLESLRALLPDEHYIYLADRAGFPYGRKDRSEVEAIVLDRIQKAVVCFNPKLIVIACNTASQAALESLRRCHPTIPFVGTVPAVKPAAHRTRSGVIAIMATKRAVEDPYLSDLIERFATSCTVVRIAAQDLVEFVELRFLDSSPAERQDECLKAISPAIQAGSDEIVLACTHFLHLADDIAVIAGPGVEIIDSREGVARRAADIIASMQPDEIRSSDNSVNTIISDELWLTGPLGHDDTLMRFARLFSLDFRASLDDERSRV